MRYRIAGALFAAAAVVLLGLAFYAAFLSRPELHLARSSGHYLLNVRWVAGWALLAAFLAGVAARYCRGRARGLEPSPADILWYAAAKIACGVAALFLVARWLLTPALLA